MIERMQNILVYKYDAPNNVDLEVMHFYLPLFFVSGIKLKATNN